MQTPSTRSFMAASVNGDYMYIFGGNADQNTRSNELYRFKVFWEFLVGFLIISAICVLNVQRLAVTDTAQVHFARGLP